MKKKTANVLPNTYNTQDNTTTLTVFNKKGKALQVTFDVSDLTLVSENGPYFAEWHKDYNNYLILTKRQVSVNGRKTFHKIPLATLILGVSSTTPILYRDQDTLNLHHENLIIYDRYEQNQYVLTTSDTALITLKNKYGLVVGEAIIDRSDLDYVVTTQFNWTIQKRLKGQPRVIANTPTGRVLLDHYLTTPNEDEYVVHLNKNPLDNRRANLRLEKIELDENTDELPSCHKSS